MAASWLGSAGGDPSGQAAYRQPLTTAQVRWMLAAIIAVPEVYHQARGVRLEHRHFAASNDVTEIGYGLVWTALCRAYEELGAPPPLNVLCVLVESVCKAKEPDLGQAVLPAVQQSGLMQIAAGLNRDTAPPVYVLSLLREFLVDRGITKDLKDMVKNMGNQSPMNAGAMLQQYMNQSAMIESVAVMQPTALQPYPDWRPELDARHPTGISWYDAALGGGASGGCVYGLLGPQGSYKTWSLLQLTTFQAALQNRARSVGLTHGLCVHVTYEQGENEIRTRAQASAAQIPYVRLRSHYAERVPLSTTGNLAQYERELELREGESERLQAAFRAYDLIHVIDMAGPKYSPQTGSGYVPELVGRLQRLTAETGLPIRQVTIDYAKIMVNRYMASARVRSEERRHLMGQLPDLLRREVADRFGCWVFIANQLDAVANQRRPGVAQHHSSAAEAKDFGENCWYCFCHSAISELGLLTWAASKTRDSAPITPLVLRVDANANALVVSENYTYQPATRRIVDREAFESVNGRSSGQGRRDSDNFLLPSE